MDLSQHNIKPLFCLDVTCDKNNEIVNGTEFISRTTSKQKMEEYENKRNNLEETIEKSSESLWIVIVKYICALLFIAVACGVVKSGFNKAMQNAPLLVISGLLCGILWLVLHFFSKRKEKKVLEEENVEQQVEDMDEDLAAIYDELNVPDNAKDIDILVFKYKIKNGKISPQYSALQATPYANPEVKIYPTDEHINIVDVENVYSFKKEEIKAIICINKRIAVSVWNKDEDPTKGNYKPYKMTINNGDVFFKPYYILDIEHDGQHFGIYFPCYELEVIQCLTGLPVEE